MVAALLLTVAGASANAAGQPEYLASFDPAQRFKPAQTDLTAILLQIAGSLEYYGSPVPYMQHMAGEHQRIDALYTAKRGERQESYRPAYMTDQYIERLSANWNLLSPNLGLDAYAKDVGHLMRDAITGIGTGKMLIDILKQHQARIFDRMVGKGNADSDFDALKGQLISQFGLENDEAGAGRDEPGLAEAINPAQKIRQETLALFKALDRGLAPADAEKVKTVLTGVIIDVGRMAQSELEAGIVERALQEQSALAAPPSPQPYSANQETALTTKELKEYTVLLGKPHFTKADFSLLDQFYSAAYDKLSERGKEELDYRVWGGVRSQASH